MTTQPDIDAIARETAVRCYQLVKIMGYDAVKLVPYVAAAIRRAQGELEKVAEAADQLEAMLSRNCGSNDDWPISLKASGDYAQELAGKLTALTRALKPYRKAKNE